MEKNARILVVDNNVSLRETIRALLSKNGYTVDLAFNGTEAIQKTKETPYNVILINIPLPDMEGEELLDLINGNARRSRKILMTGNHSIKRTTAALNKSANDYMIRPLTLQSF